MEVVVDEGAVCVAKAAPVTVVGDTVVYSAEAYRVDDGANVDDLLKKIPGIQLDASGNVTIQGKPVRQLYVNGKRYFGENVKSALRNMPADMISNVRTFERPSDYSRLSGIDDGQAEQVIDLTIKKSFMGKWRLKLNAGAGASTDPQVKYRGRVNMSNMDKKSQISIVASANDITGLSSFNNTSNNVTGSGSNGKRHYREVGATFSLEKNNLRQSGHVQYDGRNADKNQMSSAQNVYAKGGSFTTTESSSVNLPNNFTADYRLEWSTPKKTTTILFVPHFQYKMNQFRSTSHGTTFNKDPQTIADSSAIVNSSDNRSSNRTGNISADASFQISHEFREVKKGRRLTFYTKGWYTNNDGDYTTRIATRYYKIKKNPDSLLVKNQFYEEQTSMSRIQARVAYNEPIVKHFYLQLSVQEDYSYSTRNRDFYVFGNDIADKKFSPELSSQGNYSLLTSQVQADFRMWFKKFNATLGATVSPTNTWLNYPENGRWETKSSFVFYAAPHILFNYNQSKTAKLSFRYNSWVGRNSLYSMLPVASGTNPLYLHYGNPDLKPPYTHRAILDYKYSAPGSQRSFVGTATFNMVQNSVCTSSEYDAQTGGRTTRQANIDGNWWVMGSAVYNESFGKSPFSLSAMLNGEYRNTVSLLYNNALKEDEVNTVNRTMTKLFLDGRYRQGWFETTLNATGEITLERSKLRPDMDRMPWRVSTGVEFTFDFPSRARFSTDFNVLFQRGYMSAMLDRNFYVWNASFYCPLLKKKLSLKLECRDILNQLPNTVCSFNSERRSYSVYEGSNSYFLLSLIYNFMPKNQKRYEK